MTITDKQVAPCHGVPTNDERARFEEYWVREHTDPNRDERAMNRDMTNMPRLDGPGEPYVDSAQDEAWCAWLARSKSACAAQGEVVEPDGYQVRKKSAPASAPWGYCSESVFTGRTLGDEYDYRTLYATTQPAAPGVVSDAMVEAACAAHDSVGWGMASGETLADMRHWMRKALCAALGVKPSADDAPASLGWQVVEVKNEGDYGDGGPDCRTGFTSYGIADAEGRILFDSLNCDHRVCEVHEEFDDEDGYRTAWDEPSRKRAEMIVARMNTSPTRPEKSEAELEGERIDRSLAEWNARFAHWSAPPADARDAAQPEPVAYQWRIIADPWEPDREWQKATKQGFDAVMAGGKYPGQHRRCEVRALIPADLNALAASRSAGGA